MNRLLRVLLPGILVFSTFPAANLFAEVEPEGIDIEYSEIVPLASNSLLLDIKAIGNRLIAVGERGHVIFSDDNGSSWQQSAVVPTRSTLTTISSVDNRIWAAGHDSVILTSGDGGNTWTRQYYDPERQQPIMDMWFADENSGIAIGAYGLMLITSDGGQNWDDWAVNDEDDAHLNSILELEDGTLLISGEAGYSYRSVDGGETWEPLELPYQGSLFGSVIAPDDCILFFGLRGHILRSCDNGNEWSELQTGSDTTLAGAVQSESGVLIVGNSGAIVHYENGGQVSVDSHSSTVDFSSAVYLGEGRYLLAGEDGTHVYPEDSEGETSQ
jgi:photosystem II stability/assembly factor-like uncharacterized protein